MVTTQHGCTQSDQREGTPVDDTLFNQTPPVVVSHELARVQRELNDLKPRMRASKRKYVDGIVMMLRSLTNAVKQQEDHERNTDPLA